jgi:hypothetical protein
LAKHNNCRNPGISLYRPRLRAVRGARLVERRQFDDKSFENFFWPVIRRYGVPLAKRSKPQQPLSDPIKKF